jgi:transposase
VAAARQAGRRDGDTVAAWVARFNREGLAAVMPRHGGGPPIRYGEAQQRRILAEAGRIPDRGRDGTATWSLSTLQRALRRAEDGLPTVSTHTIWRTLHAADLSWQKDRTWCATGVVVRKRQRGGTVVVTDLDAAAKKSRRTRSVRPAAWRSGARMRLAPSRPCRSRAAAGARGAGPRRGRTSTRARARSRS